MLQMTDIIWNINILHPAVGRGIQNCEWPLPRTQRSSEVHTKPLLKTKGRYLVELWLLISTFWPPFARPFRIVGLYKPPLKLIFFTIGLTHYNFVVLKSKEPLILLRKSRQFELSGAKFNWTKKLLRVDLYVLLLSLCFCVLLCRSLFVRKTISYRGFIQATFQNVDYRPDTL